MDVEVQVETYRGEELLLRAFNPVLSRIRGSKAEAAERSLTSCVSSNSTEAEAEVALAADSVVGWIRYEIGKVK